MIFVLKMILALIVVGIIIGFLYAGYLYAVTISEFDMNDWMKFYFLS